MLHVWSLYVDGSPSFVWEQKLKATKYALKSWVKTPLHTPTTMKQEHVVKLTIIELGMEDGEITKTQLSLEQFAQIKTSQSFQLEEKHLRLKSRSL